MTCIHCWRYPDGACEVCKNTPQSRKKGAKSSARGKRGVSVPKGAFDSKTEANRYQVLSLLERAGVITGLQCQPVFTLIPTLRIAGNGVHGGYTQRKEIYTADFRYQVGAMTIVEDVKGIQRTKTGQIKPYIKTSSASNKVKDLMRIWANEGLHASHTFLFSAEYRGEWVYFNSNKTLLTSFELMVYSENAA